MTCRGSASVRAIAAAMGVLAIVAGLAGCGVKAPPRPPLREVPPPPAAAAPAQGTPVRPAPAAQPPAPVKPPAADGSR